MSFKVYQVGGCVRDSLLNIPVKERDWVVVDGTEEALLEKGFLKVNASFPVFLHPDTREEYALARTEKKIGQGYKGFECSVNQVTLQEDLNRRDLTINTLVLDENSQLINLCDGLSDLNARKLKHVSQAFAEDPLRVLRVARFYAKLYSFKFEIALETIELMKEMSSSGELNSLTVERVAIEMQKAFQTEYPHLFFSILNEVAALEIVFPELMGVNMSQLSAWNHQVRSKDRLYLLAFILSEKLCLQLLSRLNFSKKSCSAMAILYRCIDFSHGIQVNSIDAIWKNLKAMDCLRKEDVCIEMIDFLDHIYAIDGQQNILLKSTFESLMVALKSIDYTQVKAIALKQQVSIEEVVEALKYESILKVLSNQ